MINILKWIYLVSFNLLAIELLLIIYDTSNKLEFYFDTHYLGVDYNHIVKEYGTNNLAPAIMGLLQSGFLCLCPVVNTIVAIFTLFTFEDVKNETYYKALRKSIIRLEEAMKIKKQVNKEINEEIGQHLD